LYDLGLVGTVPADEFAAALGPAGDPLAAFVLWKSTGDAGPVVLRLRAGLADPDLNTRLMAALYLREIGPAAADALPDLRRLAATDSNPLARDQVQQAADVVSGDPPDDTPDDWDGDDGPDDDEPDDDDPDAGADDAERELADWTDALAYDPADAQALRCRAAVHDRLGDLPAAVADYAAAVRHDPGDADTWRALGWARVRLGQFAAAEADLTAGLRLAPADADLLYKRAVCRRRAGRPAEALADYGELVRREPGKPNVHQARALARQAVGDYAGQRADAEEAVRLDPDDGVFRNDLAWHLATCPDPAFRDPPRAVGLAERALELCGGAAPGVLDTLACALAAAGRFPEAVAAAEQAVRRADLADRPTFTEHLAKFRAGTPHVEPPA
jgi:Flp pilus assembly protein TadD